MTSKERIHEIKVLIRSLNSTRSKIDTTISTLTKELNSLESEKEEGKENGII